MTRGCETELFVYGTLRHDQPEHAMYCRGVQGWRPARLRGRLFRIVEGYRLLVIAPAAILVRATDDAIEDERRRAALTREAIGAAAQEMEVSEAEWIPGEVLMLADPTTAWPPLDRWEGASTHGHSVYARVVVPVLDGDCGPIAAWVYAATCAPVGSVPLPPATGG